MNCSLCKYRVQIVGYEQQLGQPQFSPKRVRQNESSPAPAAAERWRRYEPHPIEAESMKIIESGRAWSDWQRPALTIVQRLVHTSGDFTAPDDLFISEGAVEIGIRAILRCRRIVTDVTMVESGLKRELLEKLDVSTWCGVHEEETRVLAQACGITRSAAGIRRAWQKWGNDVVLAIGDAPTAVLEATRLVREHSWRPQLIVGLPVGFVGTRECKDELKRCLQVPRIINSGTRGGSPWAASVVNAIMIETLNKLAGGV